MNFADRMSRLLSLELLGVVALESHRQQCLVVGEDLGVVPDETRRALPQFGVYHYKVVMFEQKGGEFVAPANYVRHALATVTTHDLPPTAGYLAGEHIDLRERLGLLTRSLDGEALRAAAGAVLARHASLRACFRHEGVSRPVQVILSGVEVPWRLVDLSSLDAGERAPSGVLC